MLTVGSLFSGLGGIDLAFERAGARVIWNCEIDAKCRMVLRKHWPGVPRFKDVKAVTGAGLRSAGLVPDILVGGFPCTDVSVAGKRAGLAGEQSGLFFEFARILEETKPQWCIIENVPGLLSSHGGRDMGTILGVLADIGYLGAWRCLDAQYFGVAQRRRRVFLVGHLGDGRRAAEVLLEPEGGGGDPPARRTPGPVAAPGAGGCVAGDGDIVTGLTGSFGNGGADDKAQAGWLVPAVSHALCAPSTGGAHLDHNNETFVPVAYRKATTSHGPKDSDLDWERWEEAEAANTLDAGSNVTRNAHAIAFHMTQDPIVGEISPALGGVKPTTGYSTVGIAFSQNGSDVQATEGRTACLRGEGSSSGNGGINVMTPQLAVRRLLPVECLRLQGLPDDWLDGLGLADSVKYRQIGNSVAVPVLEWIARRLIRS